MGSRPKLAFHLVNKLRQVHSKCFRELVHVHDADIALAAFDVTDISAIEPGGCGQSLLRQFRRLAVLS